MAAAWPVALLMGVAFGPTAVVAEARVELRSWAEAEAMADDTLKQMTDLEKATVLQGVGYINCPAEMSSTGFCLLDGMYAGNTMPVSRLQVPSLKMHDGPSGFRTFPSLDGGLDALGTATAFPSPLALAASWDDGLVGRVAEAVGKELRAKGANALLGPAVQVHRVAKGGRNFEYLSGEDPYLGARITAAYVRGVQGAGVLACAKQFAFREQEVGFTDQQVSVDERTAWELYYPPFEAAVQAGVGCVMCSRSLVGGTRSCESSKLLEGDLKGKMGFRGFVISDWWSTMTFPTGNGLDLEMPGTLCQKTRTCNVPGSHAGHIPGHISPPGYPAALPSDLDQPARRVLAAAYRLRLEAEPSCELGPSCRAAMELDTTSQEHRDLAMEAASRSVVLLKNSGALPIDPSKVKRLALIGYAIDSPQNYQEVGGTPPPDYYSGGGRGHASAGDGLVTPREGIEERARKAGVELVARATVLVSTALEVARKSDLTIFVGAFSTLEGIDRVVMSLDFHADSMIERLAAEGPVVVLMQTAGAVTTPWRDHPNVTAVANLFLGGEQTGRAWGALLFGDFNPSGKLPVAFPSDENATVEPAPWLPHVGVKVDYTEGLHTSYRHPEAAERAAFPFGHGLSFTRFRYGPLAVLPPEACADAPRAWQGDVEACLGLNVSNAGGVSGAEVAQAYVEFPKEAEMPRLMLKGFHKTQTLAPRATELALFALTARDLSTYEVSSGSWRRQPSALVHVGASSADLRSSLQLPPPSASGPAPAGGEPGAHTSAAAVAAGARTEL